ncbi:hypothetical protein [Streptomyces halobius]|uniref:Uncharacterized protein n=1 Tax=Streptomyces halobius TaxID=2879846 RepID=A0ABY4MEN2_9ACTN|nr:hypothetical protein [Streptomyces halobius]UQA95872.1 hypothetical protein K9S39_31965 [Streptomyces halobius]
MSGVLHAPGVEAGTVHGEIRIRTEPPAPRRVLWRLPPPVPLTGRAAEPTRLSALASVSSGRATARRPR